MSLGKAIRMERITNRANGRSVIVPMDHGVTLGPIEGLVDMPTAVNNVAEGGADAVLGHVGLPILGHRGYGRDVGLILHLSASTALAPDPNRKVLVSSVERAIRYGADARCGLRACEPGSRRRKPHAARPGRSRDEMRGVADAAARDGVHPRR